MRTIHNFIIQTDDKNWVQTLYGRTPKENDRIKLDEKLELEYQGTKDIGKGFGTTELAINILVTVFVGIPVNLAAALIYDKLMNKGKNTIVNKEEKVILVVKDDIIKYLENGIEKKKIEQS